MEINKYTDIVGVVTTEAIVEGRMVLLTSHAQSHDFGSRVDLMGVKLPDTTAEAAKAKFCIAFALDNRPTPLTNSYPAMPFALRGGFDQAANVPYAATIYLTHPGNMTVPQTVPSGELALAFDKGVFTVPSGHFIYSATLVAGAPLTVADTASDGAAEAGKLKYAANGTIAVVERFNAEDFSLTFRTL
jgi:hypothetical protein